MAVIKLGDFGISRVLEETMEQPMTVVGTPYYMSPEVCENKPYTYRSDIWSLGCVLYELCTLKHAFSADNLLGLVYKIVSELYEPIPNIYNPQLDQLIKQMLNKKAEERPDSNELLETKYVHSFMKQYVRTKGQCATSGSDSRARGSCTPNCSSSIAGAPRAKGRAKPSDVLVASPGAPSATAAPPAVMTVMGNPSHSGRGTSAPGRIVMHSTAGGFGHAAPSSASASSKPRLARTVLMTKETPKEGAARRKREAADRKAEAVKAEIATRQSQHNHTFARRMKEAEFRLTRVERARAAAAVLAECPASPVPASPVPVAKNHSPSAPYDEVPISQARPQGGHIYEEYDSGFSDQEEEASEDEYEDDFEEDLCTEDEAEVLSPRETAQATHDQLPTVQEEEDFSRVMSNYQQGIARTKSGKVSTQAAQTAPRHSSDTCPKAQDRTRRLREDCIRQMGTDCFEQALQYLSQARASNRDDETVRCELEKLVGADKFQHCFKVEQIVYQMAIGSGI